MLVNPREVLRGCVRGCRRVGRVGEDDTRKLLPWNFSLLQLSRPSVRRLMPLYPGHGRDAH